MFVVIVKNLSKPARAGRRDGIAGRHGSMTWWSTTTHPVKEVPNENIDTQIFCVFFSYKATGSDVTRLCMSAMGHMITTIVHFAKVPFCRNPWRHLRYMTVFLSEPQLTLVGHKFWKRT